MAQNNQNNQNRVPPKFDPNRFAPQKKPDKKTIKRLLTYIFKDYKFSFFLVVLLIIFSTVANVSSAMFLGILIDDYITPLTQMANPVFTGLMKALGVMIVIYAVGIFSTLMYNRIMAKIAQGVLRDIRNDMFSHMQKLPIKYFDTHSHGDVMSYYTNDTDTLRQMISQSLPQMFSSLVTIISVLCAMFITSFYLTVFTLLFVGVILKVTGTVAKNSGKFFGKQQQALGNVNGYVEEMIHGQKVIKVFCHEEKAKEEFDKRNDELCENATNANKFANVLGPINNNLGHLQYALLAILGGGMAILGFGGLTLGNIATFLQLSKSFNMPISQISQQINMVVMALAGAKRIFELLDEKVEEDHGYVTLVNATYENGVLTESEKRTGLWAWKHPHSDGTITYTELKGEVVFNDVDFGYTEEKIVLHNVSLYANPGEKIAFVGATGAGKTTITNLINRFYDLADGKVRYDGININKIKKSDLRRSLGMVLQDTNLFTGTVKENIRYGKPDATDEEIIAAAKLANAHGFISRLPQGYDTPLTNNGESLSQGQRQLIAIARAAVLDPPVMILDEATSSIDTRTESIVQKGMDSLMKGRTVFVIAHRLSTTQNSNVIMVLDHGKIIERGNHEKLLEEKGKYYQLYTGSIELD